MPTRDGDRTVLVRGRKTIGLGIRCAAAGNRVNKDDIFKQAESSKCPNVLSGEGTSRPRGTPEK